MRSLSSLRGNALAVGLAALIGLGGLTACVPTENLDRSVDAGMAPENVEEVDFPDTEVADRARWIVDQLNGNNAINKRDWYGKVSDDYAEHVIPVDSLVGTLNSTYRPGKPYVASAYEEPEPNTAIVRLTPNLPDSPLDMTLSLDEEGLIADLGFEPAGGADAEAPKDADEDDGTTSGLNQ